MERTLDYKGRWRNHTVAFRVSDEEAKLLNDMVALYAAMAQIGTEGNLGYLVPRVALSLVTTAVWSAFCALSFLAPWAASARTRDALAIAGLAAAVLLIAVSAG